MKMRITGVRDGLLVLGLALVLVVLGLIAFNLADKHHVNERLQFVAWCSIVIVAVFLRAFRGHLKRPFMIPFLIVLTIIHGIVCVSLVKWEVPGVYWIPIFIVEISLGAWASYRIFGITPSG